MWGIIPAAGAGTRIQPLAFSKELLPVGSRADGERERPRAVSEYVLDRMLAGGADKICFALSRCKADILSYYGGRYGGAELCYVIQEEPRGLCDALFRPLPFIAADEVVMMGLPDTIWFPADGYRRLPDDALSFLLFEVDRPELFDAVTFDRRGAVLDIQVKSPEARSRWVWGAIKAPARVLGELAELWRQPERGDEYLGTLVNAYLERGGAAVAVPAGQAYVDVGTVDGYRRAIRLLADQAPAQLPWNVNGM